MWPTDGDRGHVLTDQHSHSHSLFGWLEKTGVLTWSHWCFLGVARREEEDRLAPSVQREERLCLARLCLAESYISPSLQDHTAHLIRLWSSLKYSKKKRSWATSSCVFMLLDYFSWNMNSESRGTVWLTTPTAKIHRTCLIKHLAPGRTFEFNLRPKTICSNHHTYMSLITRFYQLGFKDMCERVDRGKLYCWGE